MSKWFFIGGRSFYAAVAIGLLYPCNMTPVLAQSQEIWTLERSIQRVLEIAPETQTAQAEVDARQGAYRQAGVWPNPEIEIRGDDRMGKDDGSGGNDITQVVFNQPLPLSRRLTYQREIAEAELSSAQAGRNNQRLLLEAQAARFFHALQLATAQLDLAQQRLQLADKLQRAGKRREQAGELALLERLRLDLIRESAQQILDMAEGRFNEALGQFRTYLGLPLETPPALTLLEPFGSVPVFETLLAGLQEHPARQLTDYRLEGLRAGVDLARTERIPDPVLRLYRERDFLDGRRQDVNGIGIAITVPLWDRKSGRISEARAQANQVQFKTRTLKRDLGSRLKRSHLHLTHLVQQGEHYRTRVYEPARKVFDLTRKAYTAGELEILSLIDANNTYFDAYTRYLELLQEAWLEAAELRLAAGRTLVITAKESQP